jgi:hypothetical protein
MIKLKNMVKMVPPVYLPAPFGQLEVPCTHYEPYQKTSVKEIRRQRSEVASAKDILTLKIVSFSLLL